MITFPQESLSLRVSQGHISTGILVFICVSRSHFHRNPCFYVCFKVIFPKESLSLCFKVTFPQESLSLCVSQGHISTGILAFMCGSRSHFHGNPCLYVCQGHISTGILALMCVSRSHFYRNPCLYVCLKVTFLQESLPLCVSQGHTSTGILVFMCVSRSHFHRNPCLYVCLKVTFLQ